MEMSIFKWLIVILLGGMAGVLLTRYLTADSGPKAPTFAQMIDQYGWQLAEKSGNSVKYVGYKKNTLYKDFDGVQLTFTAIGDKFERSHEVAVNKKKALQWDTLFCTDKLHEIIDSYDGESSQLLGRVKVILSGVVMTREGKQGINALCNKYE